MLESNSVQFFVHKTNGGADMATAVIMPRQGNTVESCVVSKWHKKKGDKVNIGDILFTYETDKATFDEEAKTEGILLETYFEEGDDVPCLLNMCVIGEPGEDISSFAPDGAKSVNEETEKPKEDIKEEVKAQTDTLSAQAYGSEGLKISPRAKALAEKTNVDVSYANATGPNGRVIERDIQLLAKEGLKVTPAAKASYDQTASYNPTGIGGRVTEDDVKRGSIIETVAPVETKAVAVTEYTEEKLSNIRKLIAKTMHASISEMAQLTMNASFDATSIINFRTMVKANSERLGLANITINDIVIYAVAKTLLAHKDLNAHFNGESIKRFNAVNMGVAIDTPRGLMVPTVFNSDKKSLNDISAEVKDLAGRCKSGNISPDLLTGGTFTITNLGNLGVESFTPVINPPQTAILGVCGLVTRIKEENGQIKPYQAMGLSLTIDHRVVDGAPAARFLKDLCTNLENFEIMLAK